MRHDLRHIFLALTHCNCGQKLNAEKQKRHLITDISISNEVP